MPTSPASWRKRTGSSMRSRSSPSCAAPADAAVRPPSCALPRPGLTASQYRPFRDSRASGRRAGLQSRWKRDLIGGPFLPMDLACHPSPRPIPRGQSCGSRRSIPRCVRIFIDSTRPGCASSSPWRRSTSACCRIRRVKSTAGGGAILFALLGDAVVGTCALKQEGEGVFELTKMAVDESHQGLGIGRRASVNSTTSNSVTDSQASQTRASTSARSESNATKFEIARSGNSSSAVSSNLLTSRGSNHSRSI